MASGFLVRLRPTGPWRFGPDSGARDRVDRIFHSDAVYSAVCGAMLRLGELDEWLAATATNGEGPAVSFSSCFPSIGNALYVTPPRHLWPPTPGAAAAKVRWKGARFVPLSLVADLVADKPLDEDRWTVDGQSECLVAVDRNITGGVFRIGVRSGAAVDRITGEATPHGTACIEFGPGVGLWLVAAFANDGARERWAEPVRAAFRLLADSGMGGERSRGWGRFETPFITDGELPNLLLELPAVESETPVENCYWLLSLYAPSETDAVDWQRGNYSVVVRSGRVESTAGWGAEKKPGRMVAEGSVLLATEAPRGTAKNVAPEEFPHPVYRAGFAVSIPLPWRVA